LSLMIIFIIAGIRKKSASNATSIALAVKIPKSNMLFICEKVSTKNPSAKTIEVKVIALPVPIKVNRTAKTVWRKLISPAVILTCLLKIHSFGE